MKKYLLLLLVPLFFACGQKAKKEADALKARNDSLMSQTLQKDEAINEFIGSINEIQEALDTIKMKENIINVSADKTGELKLAAKDQIKNDIQTIYTLMLKNKHDLTVLARKLRNSNMKVDELQKMVAKMQKDIQQKNAELEALRDKLAKMNIVIETANLKIDTLNNVVITQTKQINEQNQTIASQDESLNTAFYIVGNAKELKANGVLDKSGKVSGDFNKDLFTKVDIRKVNEISILAKKPKILSPHPSTSYKLSGDKKIIQSLNILDYKAFWSNTKYLIIEIN
jgi:chromosome segregation ATPase